jgi:hypothetical protein
MKTNQKRKNIFRKTINHFQNIWVIFYPINLLKCGGWCKGNGSYITREEARFEAKKYPGSKLARYSISGRG